MRHVRALVYEKKTLNKWSSYLSIVQRIINSTTHESTDTTPAQLMYGNPINLDKHVLFELKARKVPEKEQSISEWATNMLKTQESLVQHAKKTQLEKDKKHKEKPRAPATIFA